MKLDTLMGGRRIEYEVTSHHGYDGVYLSITEHGFEGHRSNTIVCLANRDAQRLAALIVAEANLAKQS